MDKRRTLLLAAVLGLTAVVSPGETLQYTYDAMQRLTRVTYGDGTAIDYTYDNAGNRLTQSVTLPTSPANHAPGAASQPSVANNATGVLVTPMLSWARGVDPDAADVVAYSVYFGTSPRPPLVFSGLQTNWSPGHLECFTTYYWSVVARDNHNAQTPSPVWSFTTGPDAPTADFTATPLSGGVPVTVTFSDRSFPTCGTLTAWQWDFNNDGIVDSTNANPTFTFPATGDYSVKLTVWNQYGQSASVVKTNFISALGKNIVDLAPLSFAVDSAFSYRNLIVTYAITNNGTISLAGAWQWADAIYLSTSPVLDGTEFPVATFYESQPLPAGTVYYRTNMVTPYEAELDNYYLILKADGLDQIGEQNEANNVLAIPLHGKLPDLVPSGLRATTVQGALNQQVQVTYMVTNQGGLKLDAEWVDSFCLSTDGQWDSAHVLTGYGSGTSVSLAPGQGCSVTNTVFLSGQQSGDYYLVLQVDGYDMIVESNKANNVLAIPFTVSASDLSVLAFEAPSTVMGPAKPQVTVVWEVTNRGGGPAANWYDALYVSTNSAYDYTATIISVWPEAGPLAAGATYWRTNTVSVPVTKSGTYYLIFITDLVAAMMQPGVGNHVASAPLVFTLAPPGTFAVTPAAGPHGSISPSTPQAVASGGSLSFRATPDSGYVVNQWLVNGSVAQTGGTDFTLVNVSATTSVAVSFKLANPPSQPSLTILRSGTGASLTWPSDAAGYKLQSTTSLTLPITWKDVSAGVVVINGQNVLTNAISGAQQFYRLTQ